MAGGAVLGTVVIRERGTALRAYVKQLISVMTNPGTPSGPLKLSISPRALEITTWERSLMTAGAKGEKRPNWGELLDHAVAMQAKIMTDLARLENDTVDQGKVTGSIILGSAMGLQIHDELSMALPKVADDRRAAQGLAELQGKVRAILLLTEEIMGPNVMQEAKTLAAQLPAGGPQAQEKGRGVSRRAGGKKGKVPVNPVAILLVLIATVLIAGGVLGYKIMFPPKVDLEHRLSVMPGLDTGGGEVPNYVGTVIPNNWEGLDEPQRMRMIFAIKAVIEQHGYTNLTLQTPAGKRVATWDDQKGIELLN